MFARWSANPCTGIGWAGLVGCLLLGVRTVPEAWACGGFFCQAVPIDQAGEQIIFRQDGDMVTAIVLIQYTGAAEDFSWVLPVPSTPTISVASDMVFAPLEQITRPQFLLNFEGEECLFDGDVAEGDAGGGASGGEGEGEPDDGVDVLQELDVGPFAIQVVSGDTTEAMITWLDENGYDLTDRGEQLIRPYVEQDMQFVAMKLRQDQGVGDIQPIRLEYETDMPGIPIRLTAIAAVPDMGVLVWLLGESRAVPVNYPSVEVNYTRLNWFNGTFFAYADYQDLVTEAMNEVGGLGFATDYAGTDVDVLSGLPDPDLFRDEITLLGNADSNESFYTSLVGSFVLPQTRVIEILRRQLPLPEGRDEVIYTVYSLLADVFEEQELTAARDQILTELIDSIVVPLEETRAVFEGMPYITRMYTTLSPEEMALDPCFSFNPDLPGQALTREATLKASCVGGTTVYELILGAGTDRNGELVIRINEGNPFFSPPDVPQEAVLRSVKLSTSGVGELDVQNDFALLEIGDPPRSTGAGSGGAAGMGAGRNAFGFCGFGMVGWLPLAACAMLWLRRR